MRRGVRWWPWHSRRRARGTVAGHSASEWRRAGPLGCGMAAGRARACARRHARATVESDSMIQAKEELLHALRSALSQLAPQAAAQAVFESPKHAEHGDLAITATMGLAKSLRRPPRDIAQGLVEALRSEEAVQRWVDGIELAGPGFVNLRLKPAARQRVVREVLVAGDRFGAAPSHGRRVMVEFVSANPTGPLHLGHGRN